MKDALEGVPGQLSRKKLPARRISETRRVAFEKEVGEVLVFITIGYDPREPLRPLEVFYDDGFKSGADLEWVAKDAAVLISLALQAGYSPDEIGSSIATRLHYDGSEVPASLLGAMVAELKKPPDWAGHEDLVRDVCSKVAGH